MEKKKENQQGPQDPKSNTVMSFLGFLFASYIQPCS